MSHCSCMAINHTLHAPGHCDEVGVSRGGTCRTCRYAAVEGKTVTVQRVYTAGPMTGYPGFNFPAFDRTAAMLRARHYEVTSPAELDDPVAREAARSSKDGDPVEYARITGLSWADFLSRDVKIIAGGEIEAIVVIAGWERSRGARMETFTGNAMNGLPVFRFVEIENGFLLEPVSRIALFRAWCAEPDLSIHAAFSMREVPA